MYNLANAAEVCIDLLTYVARPESLLRGKFDVNQIGCFLRSILNTLQAHQVVDLHETLDLFQELIRKQKTTTKQISKKLCAIYSWK